MGMSASQARYLALVGKQSDLEFQGQQINQSRTTLSDQTNNLYSQLQNLEVPVPPVTNDYTTIVYSTTDGASKYEIGFVRPSTVKEGAYNVDLNYSTVGDSLQQSMTFSSLGYAAEDLKVTTVEQPKSTTQPTGNYRTAGDGETATHYFSEAANGTVNADNVTDYYTCENGKYIPATEFDSNKKYYSKIEASAYNELDESKKAGYTGVIEETEEVAGALVLTAAQLSDYYIETDGKIEHLSDKSECLTKGSDGKYTVDFSKITNLYKLGGSETIKNPDNGALLIGGAKALTYTEALEKYGNEINWDSYEAGIQNTFGADENMSLNDFYYVITGTSGAYNVKMYLKTDVPDNFTAGATAQGYTYDTGTHNLTMNKDYVDITFDSTGRISKIKIPTEYDKVTGEPIAFKELLVEAKSETNNDAYEDAMAKYEHKKYLYDREQTEINAQMSIIQAQDKKLELKLQRLDNERTQITTELEALKKVVGDNIEKTYKTFSG